MGCKPGEDRIARDIGLDGVVYTLSTQPRWAEAVENGRTVPPAERRSLQDGLWTMQLAPY